jgi:TonB family protein
MKGWLGAASLSVALHAVVVLAVLRLLSAVAGLPMLFVDLSVPDLPQERAVSASAERPGAKATQLATARSEGGPGARPVRATDGGAVVREPSSPGPRAELRAGGGEPAAPRRPERGRVPDGPPTPAVGPESGVPDARRIATPPAETPPAPSTARAEERALQPPLAELPRPVPSPADGATIAPEPGDREAPVAGRSIAAGAESSTSPRPSATASGAPGGTGGAGSDVAGGARGQARADGGGGSPGGQSVATIGGGSGGGGHEYGPYLAQWRRRIHENLRYPASARRRSLTGMVQIEIVIRPNGSVASVDIAESSTHSVLDAAAMEAVRSLPALPFPPHLVPRPLRARLPVVFDLR